MVSVMYRGVYGGELAVLKGRRHGDILRSGELHALIGLAINSFCHDCGGCGDRLGVVEIICEQSCEEDESKFLALFRLIGGRKTSKVEPHKENKTPSA